MNPLRLLAALLVVIVIACQPTPSPTVTIVDNDKVFTLQTNQRIPSVILNQAGISLSTDDRLLLNGLPITLDQSIGSYPVTLQVRRALTMTISSLQGPQTIQSSAFTVGEALQETGIHLSENDTVDPPTQFPVSSLLFPITIYYLPAHELTIHADGRTIKINSSAASVSEALAEAGIPLLGLDYSSPSENETVPADGQIRVLRVSESVILAQRPIPFESELQASASVPLDQTQILQPGENGLSVQRVRIRYEDGQEISRVTEAETIVRPSKRRLLGYGTKVEIKTGIVDGREIEYWRAVQMYATSYSPCRSGGNACHYHTASGQNLRRGMVGLRTSWYSSMQGQRLYIPGYGFASVEDVCGGCLGKPWIDLGYSDNDYEQWSSWVMVYFLTPVPANVIYVLE